MGRLSCGISHKIDHLSPLLILVLLREDSVQLFYDAQKRFFLPTLFYILILIRDDGRMSLIFHWVYAPMDKRFMTAKHDGIRDGTLVSLLKGLTTYLYI